MDTSSEARTKNLAPTERIAGDAREPHLEQYKMLREEMMYRLREIWKMQIYATAGVCTLFAWLAKNSSHAYAWYAGAPLVVMGGLVS